MERHIKLVVEITLSFDSEIEDLTAIDTFLDTNIRETVNGARMTKGLVDRDGVPVN